MCIVDYKKGKNIRFALKYLSSWKTTKSTVFKFFQCSWNSSLSNIYLEGINFLKKDAMLNNSDWMILKINKTNQAGSAYLKQTKQYPDFVTYQDLFNNIFNNDITRSVITHNRNKIKETVTYIIYVIVSRNYEL